MKNQIVLSFLVALFFIQSTSAQKGFATLTQSATSTTPVYDGAVAKLKEAGVWDLGWNFHALGAMNPAGLISLGVFPDRASLDNRLAKTNEVFKSNNINVPAPAVFEVYNIVRAPMPTAMPASAILVHHVPPAMSTAQYDGIIAELQKANAMGAPGQYFHAALKDDKGNLQVVDIWESAEKFQAFGAVLMPVLEKIFGATPPPPALYGLYNVVNK